MKTNTFAVAIAVAALTLIAGCEPPEIPEIEIPLPWFPDLDGDGFGDAKGYPVFSVTDPSDETTTYAPIWEDCDDANPEVHPGATEVFDDIDNDCDGAIDNVPYWYADTDTDGYGNPGVSLQQPTQPDGHVANNTDCNDTDASVNPDATEVFDGIDNNCDGKVDDVPTWYADTDTDGFGNSDDSLQHHLQPEGYVLDNTDCDDTDADIHPGEVEIDGDDIDNNCDGTVDVIFYAIGDTGPAGGIVFYVDETELLFLEAAPEDQDDLGAEWGCDSIDIPGVAGTAIGRGAQNTAVMLAANCAPATEGNDLAADLAANYTVNGFDDWFLPSKDELNALYNAGIIVGSGIDNAYWSSSDDGVSSTSAWAQMFADFSPWASGDQVEFSRVSVLGVRAVRDFSVVPYWYTDTDLDGYGDPNATVLQHHSQPDGYYVANNLDCDDTNAAINPDAADVFDGADNNCDGIIDNKSTWFADTDADGYGDPASTTLSNPQPDGYVANDTDCNDEDPDIKPGVYEVADDAIDNNCNGAVDEIDIGQTGPAGGTIFYLDLTGEHGLEVAPIHDVMQAEWGCYGRVISGLGWGIGTGAQNTAAILAANCAPSTEGNDLAADLAANYTLNGFDDWFLPSNNELIYIYYAKDEMDWGSYSGLFWSSTQYVVDPDIKATVIGIPEGSALWYTKNALNDVIPVRAF